MTEIAIILPAYNEELTIAKTIEAFYMEMPDAKIIVVNNNSADKTRAVAQDTFSRLKIRGEIIDEFRQGKGFAMRRAFSDVDASNSKFELSVNY